MMHSATADAPQPLNFADLGLPEPIQRALDDLGYESPSPIQARTIPFLLAGRDLLGQAQTGTGKTAAFALPLLTQIDLSRPQLQGLVLAPTRELALQVSEAFRSYAVHLPGFRICTVYGGQGYREQLIQLRQGVHVVVGTPGRVMDHMRRGTLDLGTINHLVLDEADEMLRMGFIDDVEWILEQTPPKRQVALFSATMPVPIRRIARQHLHDAEEVAIKSQTTTVEAIRQRFWRVGGVDKFEALSRILETIDHDAIIIFVRTKTETLALAEQLNARGHTAAPLNGDIPQSLREQTIARLKSGETAILVATDVAARGLDIDRVTHVINYDIPYDPEAYVHRIGRTGRAGRSGEAILFVTQRENRLLHAIEQTTGHKIERMYLPTVAKVNQKRIERFHAHISSALDTFDLTLYQKLLQEYQTQSQRPLIDIASALAAMLIGGELLLPQPSEEEEQLQQRSRDGGRTREREAPSVRRATSDTGPKRGKMTAPVDASLENYRVEVGRNQGLKPGNLVGAIANEAGIDSKYIGRIEIFDDYSLVGLPQGMPKELLHLLKKVWVAGKQLKISRYEQPTTTKGAAKTKYPPFAEKQKGRPAGSKNR